MKRKQKWIGSEPVKCEVCGKPFEKVFYDFHMRDSVWAKGCEQCFKELGHGLGVGRGQKYDLATREKLEG